MLWLRSSWFSQSVLLNVATKAVSHYHRSVPSPDTGLDYHLVHTLIPVKLRVSEQSRRFPQQTFNYLLASFAVQVSYGTGAFPSGLDEKELNPILPLAPLKAGYAVHQPHA